MTKLKSVDEYNREHNYKPPSDGLLRSGIACPECGRELIIDLKYSFICNPGVNSVFCQKCNYIGYVGRDGMW